MLGDIKQPGSAVKRAFHEHKWFFLQTKAVFEAVEGGLFKQVDYAYYVCNNCPDTDLEPNTIKREVVNSGVSSN